MPFKSGSVAEIAEKIRKGIYDPISEHLSEEIQELIKKCLALNPKERPSVFEILQS